MTKLIALDMDGTLYNDQRVITPRTREVLIRAQQKGCTLVLASGRPTAGLRYPAQILEMEKYGGILLAYNGGKVIRCSDNHMIYESAIPLPIARELLWYLESFPVNPIVDDGTYIYTTDPQSYQVSYESQSNRLLIKIVDKISEAIDFSPAKILIAAPAIVLETYKSIITAPFLHTVSFVLSAPMYLEATPVGVHKARSLEEICMRLSVDRKDVIAFGDAQNDLSMLNFAGIGIAMANSCRILKESADMVTDSNNEDGIANALERLGI